MHRKRTWFPRLVVLLHVTTAIGLPAIAWQLARRTQPITLHARMAEAGGWAPAALAAEMGVPLKLKHLPDDIFWDLTAYLWRSQTTSAALQEGQVLYAQNCAACHGEKGGGDGVFADDLPALGEAELGTGSEHKRQVKFSACSGMACFHN